MRMEMGELAVTVVCGDFNARGGIHAYPHAQDSVVDSRGLTMCSVLRAGGYELVPSVGGDGDPAPPTRGGPTSQSSMLDYVWVSRPGGGWDREREPPAAQDICVVHAAAQAASDHSLLELCTMVAPAAQRLRVEAPRA